MKLADLTTTQRPKLLAAYTAWQRTQDLCQFALDARAVTGVHPNSELVQELLLMGQALSFEQTALRFRGHLSHGSCKHAK
jgi:hypothetical protein